MAEANQPEATKSRSLLSPFLKNIIYRRGRFLRFRLNYGANISSEPSYYLSKPNTQAFEEQKERQIDSKYIYKEPPKAKKKKRWLSFLYLAINLAVVGIILGVQLSQEDNPTQSLLSITSLNWMFILAAFGCFAVGMLLDQIRFAVLIRKATGIYRFRLAYKVGAVGRYYDNITPLGTGGQPFQVVYLNKYGIKPGKGISIAMGRFIYHQIVYFICATFFLFRQAFSGIETSGNVITSGVAMTFSWIGYVICFAVIAGALIISLNKRVGTGLVVGILKLLSKIKIGRFRVIKDYKKSFKSVMSTVDSWQKTTREYNKSLFVTIVCVLASFIYFMCIYSIPYFIYCAFEGWNPDMWLYMISMAVMVDLASSFNPIPMGTGTADISFAVFFGSLFTGGTQFWALIIWRVLFYYIYFLQGLSIIIYDYAIGNRRLEKNKEFWLLPWRERRAYKRERKLNQNQAKNT